MLSRTSFPKRRRHSFANWSGKMGSPFTTAAVGLDPFAGAAGGAAAGAVVAAAGCTVEVPARGGIREAGGAVRDPAGAAVEGGRAWFAAGATVARGAWALTEDGAFIPRPSRNAKANSPRAIDQEASRRAEGGAEKTCCGASLLDMATTPFVKRQQTVSQPLRARSIRRAIPARAAEYRNRPQEGQDK